MTARGLLLAAGAGRRMGRPKALVVDGEGPWLPRAVATLRTGGCDGVTVVLGAEADRARVLLPPDVDVVEATAWRSGMGASLRAGLEAVAARPEECDAVVVGLVDLPDVGPPVVRRLLAAPYDAATLRRAGYAGIAGHPVLLGREHWAAIADRATGDRGARDYLARRAVEVLECGDLATGRDVDAPEPT